jgi:hypothetical protein
MARPKKIKDLQLNSEVPMTDTQTLESIETEIDKARAELEATKKQIEERKEQLKTTPLRELGDDEVMIMKKQISGHVKNAGLKEKIEKQKAFDSQMVTGKFINRRSPGKASEKLTYMKYEDDPVKWYDFRDGGVYTIPRGFADQINEHYYTPHFIKRSPDATLDPNTIPDAIQDVDTSNKKYSFVPISF